MADGDASGELRQRTMASASQNRLKVDQPTVKMTSDESEPDLDRNFNEDSVETLTKDLPHAVDSIGPLDSLLSPLPQKWRNWVVRFIFTWVMVGSFVFIIRQGPTWLMALVFAIQIKCFHEIITIGLAVYRLYDLPWYRALSWYFLFASNYFFFGESLIDYWGILLRKENFLNSLVAYHRLISFGLYCVGFVWFVLALRKGYYMRQFSLFAWSHVTLLLIVTQSYLIIQNLFQGMIWFLVPVSMIIMCDIMSYVFGFFFGKTPLIKLSPKKTWEGFIGGAVSTVIFGLLLSSVLMRYPFFVCPLESYAVDNSECIIPPSFQLRAFPVPRPISLFYRLVRKQPTFHIYPFLFHTTIMALFASLLGPFGGFFASGFKRAFKIKDFGDVIPGHGGLMDRFDCQLLMGTFVHVYIHTFIKSPNPGKLLQQIMWMTPEDQLHLYKSLFDKLVNNGVLAQNGTSLLPIE